LFRSCDTPGLTFASSLHLMVAVSSFRLGSSGAIEFQGFTL